MRFAMMAGAAACTALCAYLIGDVINQAYVHKNFHGLILIGIGAFGIFVVKGAATYGQQVMMTQIGNRIIADNQRRMFDKLLHREPRLFRRPALLRVPRAADDRRGAAANQALYLLITSFGRDLLSLIGLYAVMVVQDPVMSLFGF